MDGIQHLERPVMTGENMLPMNTFDQTNELKSYEFIKLNQPEYKKENKQVFKSRHFPEPFWDAEF